MLRTIIAIFLISNFTFAQFDNDYEVTLLFDSSKNEMTSYKLEKLEILYFTISKTEKEKYNYSLLVLENGKLIKGLRGATTYPCCRMDLHFNPKKNKQKKYLGLKLIIL